MRAQWSETGLDGPKHRVYTSRHLSAVFSDEASCGDALARPGARQSS
jgi:hypothetical protein